MSDRTTSLCSRADAMGVAVEPAQAELVLRYLDAMLEKNRVINLTGVRDPETAEVLHALDSLAIGLPDDGCADVLDIGSGNGFPAIGVAALHEQARVTLLERTRKKARAISELIEAAGVPNASILPMDAAQVPALVPEFAESFDLVTARAVGTPAEMARLAIPLLAPGGRLALWLAADHEPEAELGASLTLAAVRDYQLPEPAARTRRLAVWLR